VRTIASFMIWATATEVGLFATYGSGGNIWVLIGGDPGPLHPAGDPESLNSLLGAPAWVTVTPAYHNELSLQGAAVPEPSSLTTLAIGGAGILIACAIRPARTRRGRRP
jgi:PEP-CTERM motif